MLLKAVLNANLHLSELALLDMLHLQYRIDWSCLDGLGFDIQPRLSSVDVGVKVSNSVVSAEEHTDVVAAWRRGGVELEAWLTLTKRVVLTEGSMGRASLSPQWRSELGLRWSWMKPLV